ncbi:hypothetical protein LXL04_025586 [Taraxacum kok-saghyz]
MATVRMIDIAVNFTAVLSRAWSAGVDRIIVTGGSLEESKEALTIAETDARLFCTVGVHPTRCNEFDESGDPEKHFQALLSVAKLGVEKGKKRVRGYTLKTETWNMSSSHKILVTFDEFDKPIGDEGNELTQYLGTLVRMPNHVGVDYDDWRKAKFDIHPEETPEIKSWIFYSMGKKWRTWKASLRYIIYN